MKLFVIALMIGAAAAVQWNDVKTVEKNSQWNPHHRSSRNGVSYIFDLQFETRDDGSFCPNGYTGNTCTERVCAYGLSSNTSPFLDSAGGDSTYTPWESSGTGGTHSYTECSSQGVCDRTTGECSCFAGYQGKGCRRTICPNDCSGHGRCLSNEVVNDQYSGWRSGSEEAFAYGTQFWDHDKTLQCWCDRGFSGDDCSKRICPHGDDVLTSCSDSNTVDTQTVVIGGLTAPATTDTSNPFFTLEFTDHFGGSYTTAPIRRQGSEVSATAKAIQMALEALPNSAIPTVQVTGTTTSSTESYTISFSDSATSGKQNTLQCGDMGESCTAGTQPKKPDSTTTTCLIINDDSELTGAGSTHEENEECGNRGICDESTGTCACFSGHTGEACEVQSNFV